MPRRTKAELADLRAKAVELRTAGVTYRQIGKMLGVSATTAFEYVDKALADVPAEGVKKLRALMGAELDEINVRLLARLRQGDLTVVHWLHQNVDRRARLYGLNMAAESPATDDMEPLREWGRELMAAAAVFAAELNPGYANSEPVELIQIEEGPAR